MSPSEILWRVQQKALQLSEERRFSEQQPVTAAPFYPADIAGTEAAPERLFLSSGKDAGSLYTAIPLPGSYRYADYRMCWHAGFQTDNDWPLVPSARLDYRGMDSVGDARTNWELNKHFQFALLAKNYRASGERRFLDELITLFDDWNDKNPFLWGISWTSAIEVAERTMNWCYTLGFLAEAEEVPDELTEALETGIGNMAGWLFRHYSRYSSANNHLVIEISAVLHAGVLLGNRKWTDEAVRILTRELTLQNFPDGVNREESLYYQAFLMEAYALDLRLLEKNGLRDGDARSWHPLLQKMARYVRTCIGRYGEVIEFGDNDGGKLLDLEGCPDTGEKREESLSYYRYLLEFMSMLLPERYVVPAIPGQGSSVSGPDPGQFGTADASSFCENIRWLFDAGELAEAEKKPVFEPAGSADYAEGGNAVLRSADREVLIGIDHAPLGYGALCAHGHADALSFIAFVGGRPFLCDPGTYIYHTDEEARNDYRSTLRHNTVCVDGRDQSEMLGAFLWGRKANCRLLKSSLTEEQDLIEASQDGYAPIVHCRKFVFRKKEKILTVEDRIEEHPGTVFSLLFAPDVEVREVSTGVFACVSGRTGHPYAQIELKSGFTAGHIIPREISVEYGKRCRTTGLEAVITGGYSVCEIRFAGAPEDKESRG